MTDKLLTNKNQASTQNKSSTTSGAYNGIFPQASSRYLMTDEIYGLSKWDLKIMRNEIFARHGYIFQTDEMRNYFSGKSWYYPR